MSETVTTESPRRPPVCDPSPAETGSRGMTAESPAPTPQDGNGQSKTAPKHVILKVVAAIAVVAGIIVGLPYYRFIQTHESTDDAYIDADIVQLSSKVSGQVLTVPVKSNQEVAAGDLLVKIDPSDYQARADQARAELQMSLAKQRSAHIQVELTTVTTSAGAAQASSGLDAAKAGVEAARAQLGAAAKRVTLSEAAVKTAQANVAEAHADMLAAESDETRAKGDLERGRLIFNTKVIAREELEHLEAATTNAAAKLQSAKQKQLSTEALVTEAEASEQGAREGLKQAQAQLDTAIAQVGQAQGLFSGADVTPQRKAASEADFEAASAQVEQAKALGKVAELNLSYTDIRAPQAGLVTRKAVQAGDYVQTGQALMAIVPRDVYVVANFKETQLTHMHPGQRVDIEVDAFPGKKFTGHIESMQSGTGSRFSMLPPENATGSFVKVVQRVPVKILFDGSNESGVRLVPGMSVVPTVKVR